MPLHPAGQLRHLIHKPGQRSGIAFGQLADAAGESLRDAVQLTLHGGGNRRQPFVVHHESLDFVLGESGIFGVDLGFEVFLRGFETGLGVDLLIEHGGVGFQHLTLVGIVRVFGYLLKASLQGFDGDFLFLTLAFDDFGQQPFFAALFLPRFIELLLQRGEFGLTSGDGITLGGKVAGDEQGGRDEVGLEAALALLEVFLLGPDEFVLLVFDLTDFAGQRAHLPTSIGDEVAVVLHGLGPVVHKVLIDIIGV